MLSSPRLAKHGLHTACVCGGSGAGGMGVLRDRPIRPSTRTPRPQRHTPRTPRLGRDCNRYREGKRAVWCLFCASPCFSSCTPFARLSRVLRGPRVQGARSRGRRCVTAWFHIFPVLHPSASARSVARQSPPARGGQIMTHPGAVRISTTYATQAARTWDTERVHTRAGASCCALADCCTGWAGCLRLHGACT